MNKIEFDEKTRANIIELSRLIQENVERRNIICQTVIYMNGEDPNEFTLAPDLSGVVKIPKNKKEPCKKIRKEE
jgi:hypothetical protein